GNLSFETADLFNLGYADGSFDVVHLHQVLHHLSDPAGALRALARVTKESRAPPARQRRRLYASQRQVLGRRPKLCCPPPANERSPSRARLLPVLRAIDPDPPPGARKLIT
ncbi:MAG TPA: class I SAM-dependent methyltransferase, partial [Trebonia sp.]|nr:class I SAM-dependent methyltransferase [Trebonia sp.]